MKTVDELLMVFVITVIGGCIGFVIFILNHEKERKKEIRETRNNKDSVGQHNQSCDDVMASGRRETARTTGEATTSTKT